MELKAPGLKVRPRSDGTTAHYWVASAVSKHSKDYPLKTVRVHGSEDEIAARCRVLTAELKEWLQTKGYGNKPVDDGSLGYLIRLYQHTPESSYRDLRSNSRKSYDETLRLVEQTLGARKLDKITGIDFKRWFANFRQPAQPGGPERLRRAYKAIQIIRVLVKFGVVMNIPACFRLNTILQSMEFSVPKPRTVAITFEHVKAICDVAISKGLYSIALAQALQFELTLRQIDVIGRWEEVDAPAAGGIVNRGQRWRDGLLWSDLSPDGILSKITSKTGQLAEHDTKAYPFLRSMIELFPQEKRVGPMIVSEKSGRPYMNRRFGKNWREIADEAGVPRSIWNRDSRAGGVTEGSDAGADIEHLRHHANHSNISTTTRYNRHTLAKTRSVANLRVAARGKNDGRTDR